MSEQQNNPTSGGTTSRQGIDTEARAARVAAAYRANPATPSGVTPATALVLGESDDSATAAGKAMSQFSTEADGDILAEVGQTWSGLRSRMDAVAGDATLTAEGKAERFTALAGETVELIGSLRADAADATSRADTLESEYQDSLAFYDDNGPEEKRALYEALQRMPGESVGQIFAKLCEKPIGEWRKHEAQRVIAVLKLYDAGALPELPSYHLQRGWAALLEQSPNAPHVAALRNRADMLQRMSGSIESAALQRASKTGTEHTLREQLGLNKPIAGRIGRPDGVAAKVLDIPASPADEARWGKRGRR